MNEQHTIQHHHNTINTQRKKQMPQYMTKNSSLITKGFGKNPTTCSKGSQGQIPRHRYATFIFHSNIEKKSTSKSTVARVEKWKIGIVLGKCVKG